MKYLVGNPACAVAGCDTPSRYNTPIGTLCNRHYQRWLRHGDPNAGRTRNGQLLEFLERAVSYTGDECLIWPYTLDGHGYGTIQLDGWKQRASRVICARVHGPAPTASHQAAHDSGPKPCTSKACVNPSHLRWATAKENAQDRVFAGTHLLGERCNSTRLTVPEVLEIMALKGRSTRSELAKRFGVSREAVGLIHTGRTWAWLTSSGANNA